KNMELYDVYTADEAFMTGTPFCMLPVTHLNGEAIGEGRTGPIFGKLLAKWSANVGVDIAGQIRNWDGERKQGSSDAPTPYRFKRNVK
ncbi:MAG TPA: hypothetical protein PLK99_03810, partial [Burkholderiales bacterium]|nr:hypothetical protein [Burkholderiales bacterium]